MSEEILKALMQLFAIIAKQDEGSGEAERNFVHLFLASQLSKSKTAEYLELYDNFLKGKEEKESTNEDGTPKRQKLTSVLDSVKTLSICKKINKTLAQKQKVIVLVRLYELLKTNNLFTPQRIQIIKTVSEVFNIPVEEQKVVETFFTQSEITDDIASNFVIISSEDKLNSKAHYINVEGLDGSITTIKFNSVNLLFSNYSGDNELQINGIPVNKSVIYLLAPGSTIRLPRGTVYYSDIVNKFLNENSNDKITFIVEDLEFKFPGGKIGLRDINISETQGTLVGIMGASGAGKTTLLNVLSGIEKPSKGSIRINSIDSITNKNDIKGLIGYIAQDDLLIEELSVYQNLYLNAQLCFKDKTLEELTTVVTTTLQSLGLYEIRNIIVGNALNKKISGGQRKRLNIALELIREPSILFVDEPTSGLSSRDSENVMDLLKELSLKGKLIFVVIHQPSSDIFKMFDKICVLDVGGYNIFYGNPVEAVMYFKTAANHVNCDVGECELCGNVNSEIIFNILESQEVDEYGNYTGTRKMQPEDWRSLFLSKNLLEKIDEINTKIKSAFSIPNKIKQLSVFIKRDLLAKIGNKQYLLINLLEAPLLAFILSFIIRYTSTAKKGLYVFRDNDNIPAYIFMSIIVVLFIGLTVSAEEIFKDRKILKREKFLNLSSLSYYTSKIIILFTISAFQCFLFICVGNLTIGLKGMQFEFWFMLFSISCCANVIGLNISSAFNSAVTIYILIPLLIIPQMILGGAMFTYDKLNQLIGGGSGVPPIANMMPSRWGYEALMVQQFKNNNYETHFFSYDKNISQLNNKITYYLPEITQLNTDALKLKNKNTEESKIELDKKLLIIKNELIKEEKQNPLISFKEINLVNTNHYNQEVFEKINQHLSRLNNLYNFQFIKHDSNRNLKLSNFTETKEDQIKFLKIKNTFSNEYLEGVIKKEYVKKKYILEDNELKQQIDPIFMDPPIEYISFNSHFFSPYKYFMDKNISTYWFNAIIIWVMTIVLFICLYFEILKKSLNIFSKNN